MARTVTGTSWRPKRTLSSTVSSVRRGRGRVRAGPRAVRIGRADLEGDLARAQQAAAGVDDAGFLGPLAARAVFDDAHDVDALGERHVEEFVPAVDGGLLGGLQHVVDVELDVVAERQLAAQVDAVEDAGLVERHG